MSARAPVAIAQVWAAIYKLIPRAVLSGIVGDVNHSFGYHLARRDLPASDYSVQLAPDKLGASDCASALDISLPPDLMITCTKRLHEAAVNHDPRLKALREFCGTLDGHNTFPWDVYNGDAGEGLNSWDASHLWHIHLSFLREYADNYAAIAPIAAVIAGLPLTVGPNDPNWSDMATEAEIEKKIEDTVIAALRASLLGTPAGDFTHALHPLIVPADDKHGVLDRIAALEAK